MIHNGTIRNLKGKETRGARMKTKNELNGIEKRIIDLICCSLVADDKVKINFSGSNKDKYTATCKYDEVTGLQQITILKNDKCFFVQQYDIDSGIVILEYVLEVLK